MLNSLYEKAIAARGSIKEYESNVDVDKIISEQWNNKSFDKSSEKFIIAAGDGSFNKKKFLSYNFCAVGAESVIYDDKIKKIDDSDVFQIDKISFLDELLSTYMSIYELKSALRAINDYNVDYYMFDGSILGDLQNPVPRGSKQPKQLNELISDESLITNFNLRLGKSLFGLACNEVRKNFFLNISDNKEEFDLHLASIETLIILKEILKNKEKIISISKTSSGTDLCKSNLPDIAFFDYFTEEEGVSELIKTKVSSNSYFPYFGKFFKDLDFTICYVRLEKNKNVLKLEVPYKASKNEINEIIGKIKKLSVKGYPYLLSKAHNDVVITNKNMEELLKIAKIYDKTNREML